MVLVPVGERSPSCFTILGELWTRARHLSVPEANIEMKLSYLSMVANAFQGLIAIGSSYRVSGFVACPVERLDGERYAGRTVSVSGVLTTHPDGGY